MQNDFLLIFSFFALVHLQLSCTSVGTWFEEQHIEDRAARLVEDSVSSDEGVAEAKLAIEENEKLCAGVEPRIEKKLTSTPHMKKLEAERATKIYLLCPALNAPSLFSGMLEEGAFAMQHSAWRIASARPSPEMAGVIRTRISFALEKDQIAPLAVKEVADAVRTNNIKEGYTFARKGLFISHSVAFAHAMIALDARQASDDLLTYLAKTNISDIKLKNPLPIDKDIYGLIFDFFTRVPPSFSHPNFAHIYHFALAADVESASKARLFILNLADKAPIRLATILARMPSDLQLAFIKSLNEEKSPATRSFLEKLRVITSFPEVKSAIKV